MTELPPAARIRLRQELAEVSWEDYVHDQMTGAETVAAAYTVGFEAGWAAALDLGRSQGQSNGTQTWPQFAQALAHNDHLLTDWEQDFVGGFIARGYREPTPKQRAVFVKIASRLGMQTP